MPRIMATKLSRFERQITELNELADRRAAERAEAEREEVGSPR